MLIKPKMKYFIQNKIDVSRLSNMGWKYDIDLEEGLKKTYK